MVTGLYFITPQGSEERILSLAQAALQGGAQVVQYRDKERSRDGQIDLARQLAKLCKAAGACFLINDHPDVAVASDADGVHLGQQDQGIQEARALLGPNRLIGVSTRTVEQALKAEALGADYIAIGSIFPTDTKTDIELVGLESLRKVRRAVKLPLVAIGGITAGNAATVIDGGADALAVITAISEDPQPALAARELALLFNRTRPKPTTRVMTIAGSDSGGGAGIQADLKTITLLGSFGTSAITVLTAQNTRGVQGLSPASPEFIGKQIELVLDDLGTDTIKTGMLYSADIVRKVAGILASRQLVAVVDPVMIAKGGAALLREEAIEALRKILLPQTYLLTPNLPEAEALTGQPVRNAKEMAAAARALQRLGARNVLVKGGHREGDATDLLLAGNDLLELPGQRHDTSNTHGTGCSYAAAIATLLAQGQPLVSAVQNAKRFIDQAIRAAYPLGTGHGPINHFAGAQALQNNQTEDI